MEETTTTTTTTKDDSDIDSALLCAMRDGRERTALWKVEHALVDFMNKPHCQYLEVGGLGNSIVLGPSRQHIPHCDTTSTSSTTTYATKFQRCWLHRLADRFRIVRTNGILLEGAIRLLKTPQSRIPTVLLYDLPESDYIDRDGVGGTLDDDMMARVSDTTTTSTIITTTTTTTPPPPPTTTTTSPDIPMGKLKIMKRKNGNNHKSVPSKQTDDTKGHLLLRKASSSISEKEKAYEQARARIFSEEQSTSDSTTHTSATTTGPQSSSSCTDNNNNNNNNNNSCHDIVTPSTATHTSSSPLRTVNANQQQSDDSPATTDNNTNFPIHNKNNTPNKAVYRNYMDEVCDPDFRRGTAIVVPPPPSSSYASTVSSYRSTLSTTPYYHTPTGPPQSSVPGSSYANHPNGRGYSLYSYNHHHHNTIANTGGGMDGTAYVPSYPPNPYPTSTTVGLPQSSSSQPPPHATTNTPRQPQSSQAIPLTTMTAASTATSTTVVKSSISASAPAFYPSSHWNSTTHSSS